jgi:Flp pilus assembly protein TadD
VTSPWLAENRITAANDAIERNKPGLALTEARSAHAFNPLSTDALFVEALVEPDNTKALQLYRRARDLEPTNPETWYQLGAFELYIRRPRDAYRDLNHAYTLDNFLFGPKTLAGHQLDQARCKVDPATCP